MASTNVSSRGLFGTVRRTVREAFQTARHPPLDITLILPGAAGGADAGRTGLAVPLPDPAGRAVAKAVAEAATEQARELGVPARPVVTIQESTAVGTVPRLFVAGRRVRIPSAEFDAALTVRGGSVGGNVNGDESALAVTAAMSIRLAIEHDPSILMGQPQKELLVAQARAAGIHEPDGHVLGMVLEQIVAHGFAIGDLAMMRAALDKHVGLVHTAGELAEVAMHAMAEPSIEIRLSETTLRAASLHGMRRNAFVDMRRRMFRELGVTFPDIMVTIDAEVPAQAAVVRLNDVQSVPRPLSGEAGVASIVTLLEQRLRAHPSWFVSLAEVYRTTEDLKLALPDLVAAVQGRYGEPKLSLFARTFIEEQVPVRNVARLMVILLDAPPPSTGHDLVRLAEPSRRTDQGARLGARGLVSYTRKQINEEAARSRPGLETVEYTRLPTQLDAALTAIPSDGTGIDAAVGSADLDHLTVLAEQQLEERRGDGARRPLLTATHRSRSVASRLLARQYPEIVVLAGEEYPPAYRLPPADPPP